MLKNWTLILASLSLLLSAACSYLALHNPVEALVATEPVKHLGELGQGMTVPVEFELVNRCSDSMHIAKIITNCTCTTTELSRTLLAPGERAILGVKWRTGAARGAFGSDIGIMYRQAGQEKYRLLTLRVEAEVIPDIEYQPRRLIFAPDRKASQVITFSPRLEPKAAVTRVYTSHRAFTARLLAGRSQVEVAFDPSQWPKENPMIELIVETNSDNERLIKIPVMVGDTSESTSGD